MYKIQKPTAPHNTGQFITHHFNVGKAVKGCSSTNLEEIQNNFNEGNEFDYNELSEEFYVSGGTMTGK